MLIQVFPMHYFDKEYAWYKENKEFSLKQNNNINVLIMGDSTAKTDYLPKLLSEETYNYALGGASITEEYFYLKDYLENSKAPKYIIYTTYPTRFMFFDTLWTRSVYFHRIAREDLESIIEKAKELNCLSYVGDEEKLNNYYLYYYWSPTKYSSAIMNGLISPKRYKDNVKKYNLVIENKGQTLFENKDYCNEVNTIANITSFEVPPILDYYFKEFIKLCNDNNIKLIIEQPPLNEATYNAMNTKFVEEYKDYLNSIKKEYPNVTIDTEFIYFGGECFGDSAHLNEKGVVVFDKYIKEKYSEVFGK